MEYQTSISTNKPIAITIGNFDGIHLGHQRLLQAVCEQAQRLQCTPVMVTFSPHTVKVVRPQLDLRLLTTLDEKRRLVERYSGVEDTIVITFTADVAAMSAQDFMDDLCSRFSIRGIVVGADFSLGHNRQGDITFLQNYGKEHAIEVEAISLKEAHEQRISSTRIRTLIEQGAVEQANNLLGHPMIVSGTVVHGDERGRLLGFPTANIKPDSEKLLPANGVYAAWVSFQKDWNRDPQAASSVYNGVVNIGVRPTFQGRERLVEVHLLDVTMDLYDQQLIIEFIEHLRSEKRFPGIEALKAQISNDAQEARQILISRRVSH